MSSTKMSVIGPKVRLLSSQSQAFKAMASSLVFSEMWRMTPCDEGPSMWIPSAVSSKVRIRNCHVHGNRARGMLIQTRDVVIENCLFEDITCSGLHICTDACDWWESLGVRDVTIKGCVFRRNCFWGNSALHIFSDIPGGQSAPGVHKGIRILDNTFEDNAGGSAINIGSSEDVELAGNKFVKTKGPAITIVNSRQVRIRDAGELEIGKGIEVGGSSDPATISVSS